MDKFLRPVDMSQNDECICANIVSAIAIKEPITVAVKTNGTVTERLKLRRIIYKTNFLAMAKQISLITFTGRLGNIIGYCRKGQQYRIKSTFTPDRLYQY
jgi:hypothetical protein